jgi:hypothetical protein
VALLQKLAPIRNRLRLTRSLTAQPHPMPYRGVHVDRSTATVPAPLSALDAAVAALSAKADGLFLYAHLLAQHLDTEARAGHTIDFAGLDALPTGLDEVYAVNFEAAFPEGAAGAAWEAARPLIELIANVQVLEAMQLLLSVPGAPILSILAVNSQIVVASIEDHYEKVLDKTNISGYEYLEKIVQIPFALPEPSPEKIERLLSKSLEGHAASPEQVAHSDSGPLQRTQPRY